MATIDFRIMECENQAKNSGLLRLTRDRLKTIRGALEVQKKSFSDVLSPLLKSSLSGNLQSLIEIELAGATALFEQFGNVFRDWVWGEEEIQSSLAILRSLTPDQVKESKVLFIGSGACRVPYEWHRLFRPKLTVATEINPLLFLIAKELISGSSLQLSEFPQLPVDKNSAAKTHEITAEAKCDDNFQLLLTDFCNSVFCDETFDIVVTDWFIDIVDQPLAKTISTINQLLKEGGTWINLGPTMFQTPNFVDAFTKDEVLWMVTKYGFEVLKKDFHDVPYQCSPYDAHKRRENILGFSAKKTDSLEAVNEGKLLGHGPEWISDTSITVPAFSGLGNLAISHQLRGHIMEVVDGSCSIDEIADRINQAGVQLPPDEVRKFVKKVLLEAYQKQQPRQALNAKI